MVEPLVFFFYWQKGQGAPSREPVVNEEEQKKMMAYYYKKQEEWKVRQLQSFSVHCDNDHSMSIILYALLPSAKGLGNICRTV